MFEQLAQLIKISRKYGSDKRFVIAGGGNTSYKNDTFIWVKASGHALATITEEGFAILDRKKLQVISEKTYSSFVKQREVEVKNDLFAACITKDCRPSVETSMHNALNYAFVVHLHPTLVNGVMCSKKARTESERLFGNNALFIPYTDPGYRLFKKVDASIKAYKKQKGRHPSIILLQNHGIFVSADTTDEIEAIYDFVIRSIETNSTQPSAYETNFAAPYNNLICETLPAIRMMVSKREGLKTLKLRNNGIIRLFSSSKTVFDKIAAPFTPDDIVYCESNYIYLTGQDKDELLKEAEKTITSFETKHKYTPKVIVIKGIGLVAVGANAADCDTILDVYENIIHIAILAQSFGGEQAMNKRQIHFIKNWEAENYRHSVSIGNGSGRLQNKILIITGAAQGFGEGIAECLLKEGANIVVADLNETIGKSTVERLHNIYLSPTPSQKGKTNRILFVYTDVTDKASLQNLIHTTVCHFGGLDAFISNAGVLRAGGLDDFKEEVFEFVTKVNYSAYFYCTQAASRIMKLQNLYAPDNYGDIIQINSKSGLRGSKANFAYSGGKFGGIGLTQSFALELAPFRIKVNAICPGNFYEGPLWSDPVNGLFQQYLKTGKVPGAKTIDDVRKFYMSQVPMNKGTNPNDVTKAILYLIDQTCETGQALPITGGQVMIS